MRQALFLKILIGIIGFVGTFLSSLFFYFLNSLKNTNQELKNQIVKLTQKLDELKQKYFQDVAGFGKIFAFKNQLQKLQANLIKRIERIQNIQDNLKK